MRAIITPEEAARLDQESRVPVAELMERAGAAVALEAARMSVGYGSRVIVLAGPGNNGGDGYVAARRLQSRGAHVEVQSLGPPRTAEAGAACRAARAVGIGIEPIGAPVVADLVVDGLFGGGFRPGVPEEVVAWINSKPRVLAIDIPSGVDPVAGHVQDHAFVAERTVTFDYLKAGHVLGSGPDYCGTITIAPIGLGEAQPRLKLTEAEDASLPTRARDAHKWSAGSVLVVGGAPGMTGAALLCARAALAFGAGAVGVAVPDDAAAIAAAAAPELLHYPLDSVPDRYRALVIGPGLSSDHDELARKLIESWNGPVVVDADALSLASSSHLGQLVLTPHAGEFKRLTGEDATPEAGTKLSRDLGAVVVLKGNPTVVCNGGIPWVVNRGGPELATIGSGDVLAGMIGALVAVEVEPAVAARTASYWHGVAGFELAARTTVTATGLLTEIGRFR